MRFARSEAFADAALADATIKPGAHAAAFDEAVDRLAKHVLTAPSSMRARMRRRAAASGGGLAARQRADVDARRPR